MKQIRFFAIVWVIGLVLWIGAFATTDWKWLIPICVGGFALLIFHVKPSEPFGWRLLVRAAAFVPFWFVWLTLALYWFGLGQMAGPGGRHPSVLTPRSCLRRVWRQVILPPAYAAEQPDTQAA